MSLEEMLKKENKKNIYDFYKRIVEKPLKYEKITRDMIYHNIISEYDKDPEIILRMCSVEELNILKELLDKRLEKKNYGYIEYILFSNLKNNHLVLEENNEYYIPDDLINYVKMAINLWNEKEVSFRDLTDSIIMGLIRIHNVVEVEEFCALLKKYRCFFASIKDFKKYVLSSPKLNKKVNIIKYKKIEYIVSLEYDFYEEVLANKKDFLYLDYTLEDLISIGKYKINLFKEPIFKFLNFLEVHMEPVFVDYVVIDIVRYMGLYVNDLTIVKKIAADIDDLYNSILEVLPYLPIWVFNGNDLDNLKNKN